MEIIPGILEKDWTKIKKKLEIVKPFAKSAHIDILDGKFAPNTTFLDPTPFVKYSHSSTGSGLFLELHMMVEEPIQYLKPFSDVGFKRFIVHVECLRQPADQAEFVTKARELGEVGLAIDGQTPLTNLKVSLTDLDCVLIMTIKAGFSGQKFNPEYLKKVEILRSARDDINIEVDGGINDKTITQAIQAGADRFVANSFIFNSPNPQEQFDILKNIAETRLR